MQKAGFIACILFAVLAPPAARAADCPPLKEVNSIPVRLQGSRILVPVHINDRDYTFMLDTAGVVTQIAPSVVRDLHLATDDSGVKLLDMYGHASSLAARAALTLGILRDTTADLQVSPIEFPPDAPYQGILAADYLGQYDVELDLAAGKLNYFSRDHCAGRVVYWNAAAIAVVPFVLRDNHIRLSASLDNHDLSAIFDTGAPVTTLTAAAAKRVFNVTEDTPGNIDAGAVDGKKQFVHVFPSMGLDGIAVANARVLVMPDLVGKHDVNNGYVTGTRTQRVDDLDPTEPPLILGMDVIRRLHFFFAFGESKLYVTPGGATAPAK